MGTRKPKKLKVMKETLRQLTPEELNGVQGGGGGNAKDERTIRTYRCAC